MNAPTTTTPTPSHETNERILAFLHGHHVLGLACCDAGTPWAASVFYAVDPATADASLDGIRLLFLTDPTTRHGGILSREDGPEAITIAATIAGQPDDLTQISGLQLTGTVRRLTDETDQQAATDRYHERFPAAAGMHAPIWAIAPTLLKLTDNRLGFGTKFIWERPAPTR